MECPELIDFAVAISFGFGFFAARWLLDKFLFRRLAFWVLGNSRGPGHGPWKVVKRFHSKVEKTMESLWKLGYYTTVEMFILWATYRKPWLTDREEWFRGWPNQELEFPLMLYNMCQCGFYLYSIVAIIYWETRRKDFLVMISHHVITVFLIAFSYLTGFFRLGSIILALHDASDVLLEAAKILNYAGKETEASVCFGLFATSWLTLRLAIFPFWIIRGTSCDAHKVVPMPETYKFYMYYIVNTMLITLLVFHIYWWVMIFRMIVKQFANKGKVGEDIRSDSEDD